MPLKNTTRRAFFGLTGAAAGMAGTVAFAAAERSDAKKLSATEILMREHGVLQRVNIVYRECAARLTSGQGSDVPPAALHEAAMLFRRIGEKCHETKIEEEIIFPALVILRIPVSAYADILQRQHSRARAITDYILSETGKGSIASASVKPLAAAMTSFARMSEDHGAVEDTIVFPAWKNSLSDQAYGEMAERFAAIEREQLGSGGFDTALHEIIAIETNLGLDDLAFFTAPPPKA